MSTKHLAVCPRCHQFYSTEKEPSTVNCEECGSALQLVEHGYDLYSSLNDEEKTAFKEIYIKDHFPGSKPYHKPFEPLPQSGWVGFVGFCGWFVVLTLVFAGVFIFLTGNFIGGLAFIIFGPVSGGTVVLFSIVAKDVRHIRNQVDKLHHDQKYKKP